MGCSTVVFNHYTGLVHIISGNQDKSRFQFSTGILNGKKNRVLIKRESLLKNCIKALPLKRLIEPWLVCGIRPNRILFSNHSFLDHLGRTYAFMKKEPHSIVYKKCIRQGIYLTYSDTSHSPRRLRVRSVRTT